MRMRMRLLLMLVLPACDGRGGEGQPCEVSGGVLTASFRCDEGLVCNVPLSRCERPNQGALGARCGSDAVCRPELWCPPGVEAACAVRLREGEACPSGVGCEAGLRCEKGDAGVVCVR